MLRARDELNLREAFELARETIRSLMLINGGGAAAVLSFFGSLLTADHAPALNRGCIIVGLAAFSTGLFLGTVAGFLGYIIQTRWGAEVPDTAGDLKTFNKLTIRLNRIAVVVAALSLLAFIIGVVAAGRALL